MKKIYNEREWKKGIKKMNWSRMTHPKDTWNEKEKNFIQVAWTNNNNMKQHKISNERCLASVKHKWFFDPLTLQRFNCFSVVVCSLTMMGKDFHFYIFIVHHQTSFMLYFNFSSWWNCPITNARSQFPY